MKYYKYNFVSPHRLYARVQEEMRSYFATGAVDSLLFPLWTDDCIKKFRRTFLPIKPAMLCVVDGKAQLPDDFKAIRAAWATTSRRSEPFSFGNALYYPKEYSLVTISDAPMVDGALDVNIETHTVTHKVTKEFIHSYTCSYLLKAGNISQSDDCPVSSVGLGDWDSYDIDGNCFLTNFGDGVVHIQYYGDGLDEEGYQLIPDDYFIQDYIRKYLICMTYLQIFNQTTDETFNQVMQKMKMAEVDANDAYIRAYTESISETQQQRLDKITKSYRRLNQYRIR